MPLIYIICVVAIVLACGGLALGASGVSFWLLRKRPLWLRIMVSLLVMVPFYWALENYFGPWDAGTEAERVETFEREVQMKRSPDVASIEARYQDGPDGGIFWIRFEAASETVDALLKRFQPSDAKTFAEKTSAGERSLPKWWRPAEGTALSYYQAEPWKPEPSYSFAILAHDAEKHVVYFCYDFFF